MRNSGPVLEIRDLTVVYDDGKRAPVTAVKRASLSVHEGEIVAITGRNGSGKSTLLKAIAGQVPADNGKILIDGNDVGGWASQKRARLVACVQQDVLLNASPNLAVWENLAIAKTGRWLSLWPAQNGWRGQSDAVLRSFLRLEQCSFIRSVMSLSGGQRQIVAMFMSLQRERPLLLLDEFTASLDDEVREQSWMMIREYADKQGIAVVLVTHDRVHVSAQVDRVGRMRNGILDCL